MVDGSVTIDVTLSKEQLKKALKSVKKDLDSLKTPSKNIADTISKGFNKMGEAATKAGSTITKVFTTSVIGIFTASAMKAKSFITTYESAISLFEKRLGSKTSADEMYESLLNIAKASTFAQENMIKAGQTLVAMGVDSKRTAKFVQVATDAISGMGGSGDEIEAMAEAFGKMSNQVVLHTDDLNQLATKGLPVWDILAKKYGKTKEKVQEMASKGLLPATETLDYMSEVLTGNVKGMEQFSIAGTAASQKGGTLKGVLDGLNSSFRSFALNLLGLNVNKGQTENYKKIINIFGKLGKVIETIGSKFSSTGNLVGSFLTKVEKWLDKLQKKINSLSKDQIEKILKTILKLAAAGPILLAVGKGFNVISKSISAVSGAIGGIKTLTSAIGLMRGTITTASASATTLASVLGFLTSPVGLAAVGITALAGALIYFATRETEAQKKAKEFAKEMAESRQEMEDYRNSIDENTKKNLSHVKSVEILRKELSNLVDENGKVKEGYKSRVDFILKELNEALGTEYKLNGDIIEEYKRLQGEIDTTIEKKRAQFILEGEEQKYKKAVEEGTDAVERMKKAEEELGMTYEEAKKKLENYNNAKMKRYKYGTGRGFIESTEEERDMYWTDKSEIEALENLIKSYEDAEYAVKEYAGSSKKYADLYAKYAEGKYNEIAQTITITTEDWTSKTLEELNTSITEQSKSLNIYKDIYKKTGYDISLQQAQQTQQNLDNLAAELTARTQTLDNLGQNEIDAWKTIAEESYSSYSIEISKMAPEMQQKIQEATGIIAGGTPEMQAKAAELGKKTVDEFDKSADAKQKALNTITGYLNGLDDNTKKELLKQAGIEDVDIVLDELNKGNLSEEHGRNLLEGLWKGLQNGTWRDKILGAASGLASAVNEAFTGKKGWDEHSPSKKMKKYAEYYVEPISDVMNKKKSSIVSSAQDLAQKINSVFDKESLSNLCQQMQATVNAQATKLSANITASSSMNKVITVNTSINADVDIDGQKAGRILAPSISKTLRTAGV